jgi:integrase
VTLNAIMHGHHTDTESAESQRHRLTERDISRLTPPAAGNRIVYDAELPGFGARVTAAGVVSFVLNYRIHGRERRYTIGRAPEYSVAAARDEAMELRRRIRNGEDPLAKRELLRLENPVMADLAREYLSRYAEIHKRPSSIRNDRSMFAVVTAKLGKTPVASITRQDIENLHRSLQATPYRANRTLALLRKAFGLAVEWEWRGDNPAAGVKKFPEEKRARWLDSEEIARLLAAFDSYVDQSAANALRLVLYTGSRKGEVLAARWEDLDLKAGRWRKPKTNTKQKREELIPLADAATKLLRKMRREASDPAEGWIFPGRSDGAHLENLKQHWKDICEAAKLGKVRIHDLRHTFASHLVSSGESLATVGALLGHTQMQTTMRYAHLADTTLRNAANRFAKVAHGKGN